MSYLRTTAYVFVKPVAGGGLERFDRYRCAERDGARVTAAHLVIGPNGQHVLQKAGQRLAWPIGIEPHPASLGDDQIPRDES